jgi:hypothetical protein
MLESRLRLLTDLVAGLRASAYAASRLLRIWTDGLHDSRWVMKGLILERVPNHKRWSGNGNSSPYVSRTPLHFVLTFRNSRKHWDASALGTHPGANVR